MPPRLKYYDISPRVIAFSTMRAGGCSKGSYSEFNINPYCGDDLESVRKNRKSLCRLLGVEEEKLLLPHQVHGCSILEIDNPFFQLSASARNDCLQGVDALVTHLPRVCIGVSTADCVPVLLYDEQTQAIAAIHAGWRGTQQRIVEKVLQHMAKHMGCRVQGMKALIGPSISLDAFEVGEEVVNAFQRAGFPMSEVAAVRAGKWHVDLWRANEYLLEAAGMDRRNILLSGICTFGQVNEFFSARRLTIHSGRIYNGIMLREG